MNERFSADPHCCADAHALKDLLEKFGTHTGRYLVGYPDEWEKALRSRFEDAGDIEKKRVNNLLHRLKERIGLLRISSLSWDDERSWIENAIRYADEAPRKFDGLLVGSNTLRPHPRIHSLVDWYPHATEEERIVPDAIEFERVSRTLLRYSNELVFIDPYLDFSVPKIETVVSRLLATIAQGQCRTVTFFARGDAGVLQGGRSPESVHCAFRNALSPIKEKMKAGTRLEVRYCLVNDVAKTRMHDRYLLSKKGGIEFSQGFQEAGHSRRVTARPLRLDINDGLFDIFMSGKHDMKTAKRWVENLERA